MVMVVPLHMINVVPCTDKDSYINNKHLFSIQKPKQKDIALTTQERTLEAFHADL